MRRPKPHSLILSALLCAGWILALAPAALAQGRRSAAAHSNPPGSGGAGFGATPTGAGGGSASGGSAPTNSAGSGALSGAPLALPANLPESVSGDGITVQTRASTLLRHGLRFSGAIDGSHSPEVVEIQRRGRGTRWRWVLTARAAVSSDGRFLAFWRADQIGLFEIRAVALHASLVGTRRLRGGPTRTGRRPGDMRPEADARTGRALRASVPAGSSPPLAVTVYRPGYATLYGPGLYGRHTACGEVLKRSTIGVANRTLPCGTEVSLDYRGRALVVPVIDRGPYANGADWDLTIATADALGMHANAVIGAIALPNSAASAANSLSSERRG